MDEVKTREEERTSPDRPIAELELTSRATQALADAGILNVGDALEKMEKSDTAILAIDGFGAKSLTDLKKALRRFGYTLPEDLEQEVA
ncbi:MAG: DNA-directed RNA polymerase subunit alpha C-terminal domain-containing protein [Anaerolineales bacterium]|nr:DNA-directed RNA polymerase subunit alpha C-terminal domain-containing protein [Anaerolineales bacterium]